MNSEEPNSEFGKGLSYCLALFLCHSERKETYSKEMGRRLSYNKEKRDNMNAELWFYDAADHLYDMQIPNTLPIALRVRLFRFREKVMGWRMPINEESESTKENKEWAIAEAKFLLRAIDKAFGVPSMKGDWE